MCNTTPRDTRASTLLTWFDREGRAWPWRASRDPWVVLVCEVCSQQTQLARAAVFIDRILDRFPSASDLARAELGELLVLWQGLGYPRRARNLWLAAQQIDSYGWLQNLQSLPGVGPYTSAAVRCFAFEDPVVPDDINTRRVRARLFPDGAPEPARDGVLSGRAWEWASALMELGQTSCRARAACDTCPMASVCPSVGTDAVIASPRQARYTGSMRQRRGELLRVIARDGAAAFDIDIPAAESLIADGLAVLDTSGGDAHLRHP